MGAVCIVRRSLGLCETSQLGKMAQERAVGDIMQQACARALNLKDTPIDHDLQELKAALAGADIDLVNALHYRLGQKRRLLRVSTSHNDLGKEGGPKEVLEALRRARSNAQVI